MSAAIRKDKLSLTESDDDDERKGKRTRKRVFFFLSIIYSFIVCFWRSTPFSHRVETVTERCPLKLNVKAYLF